MELLRKIDRNIRVIEKEEYPSFFDLKGKYEVGDKTLCVSFPLKVVNTRKWCEYLKSYIVSPQSENPVSIVKGKVTSLFEKEGRISGVEV